MHFKSNFGEPLFRRKLQSNITNTASIYCMYIKVTFDAFQ